MAETQKRTTRSQSNAKKKCSFKISNDTEPVAAVKLTAKSKDSKNKLIVSPSQKFKVGDLCYAKVKGFVEWPA